jgi:hypothetical protein
MKRQPRHAYNGARYPDLKAFLGSRRVAGAGLLAGALAMTGCEFPWVFRTSGEPAIPSETADTSDTGRLAGDIADTAIETFVQLPSEGPRHLVFTEPWGEIDYHLEIVAASGPAAGAIATAEAAVLAAVDEALLAAPVQTYEPGQDLGPVQAALRTVIAKVAGIAPDRIENLVLVVESYTDEGDIDGDMGVAR